MSMTEKLMKLKAIYETIINYSKVEEIPNEIKNDLKEFGIKIEKKIEEEANTSYKYIVTFIDEVTGKEIEKFIELNEKYNLEGKDYNLIMKSIIEDSANLIVNNIVDYNSFTTKERYEEELYLRKSKLKIENLDVIGTESNYNVIYKIPNTIDQFHCASVEATNMEESAFKLRFKLANNRGSWYSNNIDDFINEISAVNILKIFPENKNDEIEKEYNDIKNALINLINILSYKENIYVIFNDDERMKIAEATNIADKQGYKVNSNSWLYTFVNNENKNQY